MRSRTEAQAEPEARRAAAAGAAGDDEAGHWAVRLLVLGRANLLNADHVQPDADRKSDEEVGHVTCGRAGLQRQNLRQNLRLLCASCRRAPFMKFSTASPALSIASWKPAMPQDVQTIRLEPCVEFSQYPPHRPH